MATQDQRPRFYEGQYLAADDINAIVDYDHEMIARHELGLHGWGIAVGLTLIEQPTAGAPKRQNVFLAPGLAEDGFGRKVVALTPAKLPEALFANIAYAADVDDPAKNSGTPPGRFVKVWLAYDEQTGKPPGAGFINCDAGDAYARVQETYRFLIGDQTDTHKISVAGQTVNAADALKISISPAAPSLPDESVPQQTFPSDNLAARWLIPIGYVRWVVVSGGGGYFVDRNIDANDKGDDRIRKLRHYIGSIAEAVNGTDGAIILRNRTDDPNANGRFQARLQSSAPIADTLRDLVWVEGNLRAVGDVRLAGGALRFADINGSDENTPLSIERVGDKPLTNGKRALDAVIGPDAQTDNRFAVATVVKDDPDPAKRQLSEKLSVLSGGTVGVNNDSPAYALHVKGDRIRLDSTDGSKSLDLRTDDGSGVTAESRTSDFVLRATGGTPSHDLILNPDATDGNVGIGNKPASGYKLDVKAKAIKLGLEDNGGGQLILKNNPGDNKIFVEAFDNAGTGNAAELLLTGRNGANAPQITLQANTTYVAGRLGVATAAPDQALTVNGNLHVLGDNIVLENAARTKNIFLFTNGSDVDLATTTNDLSIRSPGHNCLINWLAGDGRVGIGTGSPQQKLHVGGEFLQVDGAANESAYLGGDGSMLSPITGGADVQIGSFNNAVQAVHFWNTGYGSWMDIHCRHSYEWSDREAKTHIGPLKDALRTVQRLRGVQFDWKDAPRHPGSPKEIGLIAQEVEEILPQIVARRRGMATVSYTSLVPILIEAVKELKQQNDDFAGELKTLKAQIAALAAHRTGHDPRTSSKAKGARRKHS